LTLAQITDPDGYNIFYFDNGRIASEGYFSGGKPEGLWKAYYPSGVLKSIGNKKEGFSDSVWTFYDEEGRVTWVYPFENDKKNGCAMRFDSLGNKTEEVFFVNNIIHGERVTFYPGGAIKGTINYENGNETGMAYEYAPDGTIITEELYDSGWLKEHNEYNRTDSNGKKTGKWRTFYPDGTLKSEANYKDGQMSGIFKEFDKKGKLVDINSMINDSTTNNSEDIVLIELFKTYYPSGKVKLKGGLADGLRSGIYREYSEEGLLINGYIYQRDTVVAEGLVRFDGNYEGEWKEYFKTGELKAIGKYEDGIKSGKWVFYYKSGKKEQEGSFKNNIPYGEWNWFYLNGTKKKQEYFNAKGELEGVVTEWDSTGSELAHGEYYNGRQEGAWFYHVGDFREVGAYTVGLQNGLWKHYYKNGKTAFSGTFYEGEAKGKHIWYFDNGMKKTEGKYAGGEKSGIWRSYNERGEEIETLQYRHGELFKINGFKVEPVREE